jgi:uncharacterized membrane protein YedE/YeeE
MTEFTPISAAIGGAMIGVSAVLLLVFNGKIAGISGIFNSSFTKKGLALSWRLLFLLGIVIGPIITSMLGYQLPSSIDSSWLIMALGGLLVGFGSNLGNGCTSGHGICGMGRLSPRSIVATLVFMLVALATVFVIRHLLGGSI